MQHEILARLIDRAIALGDVPRWTIEDDNDADVLDRRFPEHGIMNWGPTDVSP